MCLYKILITLLFIYSGALIAQTNYYISWQSANHQVYNIQQSTDNITWKTIGTQSGILTQNTYTYELPVLNYWYRITADKVVSESKLAVKLLPVDIIGFGILGYPQSVYIVFTTQNESNIKYYQINRSYDAINFIDVLHVPAKGNSKYFIEVKRPVNIIYKGWWFWRHKIVSVDHSKGLYQIIGVDNDGNKTLLKTLAE